MHYYSSSNYFIKDLQKFYIIRYCYFDFWQAALVTTTVVTVIFVFAVVFIIIVTITVIEAIVKFNIVVGVIIVS